MQQMFHKEAGHPLVTPVPDWGGSTYFPQLFNTLLSNHLVCPCLFLFTAYK